MRKLIVLLLMSVFGSLFPTMLAAQDYRNVTETDAQGRIRYFLEVSLEVSPQKIETPALTHKLSWGYDERTTGNAAVKYNFAMRQLCNINYNNMRQMTDRLEEDYQKLLTDPDFFAEQKTAAEQFEKELAAMAPDAKPAEWELRQQRKISYKSWEYEQYCSVPKEEFPMEKAREFTEQLASTFRFQLEPASRCEHCDWEHFIRGNRDPFSILLPEIQEARSLGRALQVKARYEIYSGNFEEAVRTIRVGKTMARHIAMQEPILITHLIAVSVDGMMNFCINEFQQQSGAPNLYWSLTALPATAPRYPAAIEMESEMLRMMIPELKKAMDRPEEMTDADWKQFEKYCFKVIPAISEAHFDAIWDSPDIFCAAANISAYPKAKAWLIEQGKTSEEIEAMSVAKVVGLWSVYRYEIVRDEILKTRQLPHWQMVNFKIEETLNELGTATPLDLLIHMLVPAIQAANTAFAREHRENEVLRIVDAIRDYAAEHEGKLPPTLADVTNVPIPSFDPLTGKPFEYRIENDTAVIESAVIEFGGGSYNNIRTKIKIRK